MEKKLYYLDQEIETGICICKADSIEEAFTILSARFGNTARKDRVKEIIFDIDNSICIGNDF